MAARIKKHARIIIIGFLLTAVFLLFQDHIKPARFIDLKIYDVLTRIKHQLKRPPRAIDDIVIIAIDNSTVSRMPHRWPYPRSVFANVIKNLMTAEAKVIAFDFLFLGKSENLEEDQALASALEGNNKVILAATIDERGALNIRSTPILSQKVPSGIVTKLQDPDGIIRHSMTYFVNDEVPPKAFLAWEMVILKTADGLSIEPVRGDESLLSVMNDDREKWLIPVDPRAKSFFINFRANTDDFKHISLYDAYKGDFEPSMVKDKIVMIGFVSSLLGDVHNTALGWMPGVILNANSFLTLYAHDFISDAPPGIERLLTILGVIFSLMVVLFLDIKIAALIIAAEILVFYLASYALLTMGYVWDYFVFPFCVGLFPFLSRHIYSLVWQRKKFYWT